MEHLRVGHATLTRCPGNGGKPRIDEQYQASDQRHWTSKCGRCGTWTALEKEFPVKLGQEVRVILPREDGSFYRACPKCDAELDLNQGEWVADYPDRSIHGYRISQLFSSKVDPGEILKEYRTTRYPDRFYNLKIGIPWADLERRLDLMSVLSLCGDDLILEESRDACVMGVDTGRQLHTVIVKQGYGEPERPHEIVHIGAYGDFSDLSRLMNRFDVRCCVIDGLPETHATRTFAREHAGTVFLNFFNEHQRGQAKWDGPNLKVEVNRTEVLDASRAAIRERVVRLPRRAPIVEEFARHMTADAKILEEDEETGAKKYRYVKAGGENHYSLAFTYAWTALDMLWPKGVKLFEALDVYGDDDW